MNDSKGDENPMGRYRCKKKNFIIYSELVTFSDNLFARYNRLIKQKRTYYYTDLIKRNSNKSKCMWCMINSELGRTKNMCVAYTDLVSDANGLSLTSKLHLVVSLYLEFGTAATLCSAPAPISWSSSNCSLQFVPFTPHEVLKILSVHIALKNSTEVYET